MGPAETIIRLSGPGSIHVWTDIPGTDVQVRADPADAPGTFRFRRKPGPHHMLICDNDECPGCL